MKKVLVFNPSVSILKRLVPAQYVHFDLILWYIAKIIPTF